MTHTNTNVTGKHRKAAQELLFVHGGTEDFPTHLAQSLAEAEARGIEKAANACNERGKLEQENYGLTRGTQNFYRARDIIRALIKENG